MAELNLNTGKKIAPQEPGEPRQANWKFNLVDTGTAIAALDVSTGRTHRYAFNDGVSDSVGSDHLAWSAGAAYGSGVYGKAAQFDGTNRIEDDAADNTKFDFTTGDFTICGFVYFSSLTGAQTIFAKKASGSGAGYRLYKDSSHRLVANISDGTDVATATGSSTLAAATWYFVGLRRTATAVQIWLNEIQEAAADATAVGSVTNTQVFTVGRDSSGATQFMTSGSRVDHLEFYSDDLTDAQFIQKFRDLHSGQLRTSHETASGYTKGHIYPRNNENSGDLEAVVVQTTTHAAGDIAKSDGADWVRFAKGTANQVLRTNTAVSDLEWASGFLVSINLDDTDSSASIPNVDTNLKTYALGANSYAKIIARATVNISPLGTAGVDQIITYNIKIGATTKSYSWRSDPTTQKRDAITLELSAVQTGAATIAVSHGAPAADGATTSIVKSLYVFGVT